MDDTDPGLQWQRCLLAAELHDGVSQPLVGVFTYLQSLAAQRVDDPELAIHIGQVRAVLFELCRMICDLRRPVGEPPAIDLAASIRDLAAQFAARTGIDVDVQVQGDTDQKRGDFFAFRVVQEALANAGRHSGASRVELRLRVDRFGVWGLIWDNGQGFHLEEIETRATHHHGLKIMKERAEYLGGNLAMTTSSRGTRIEFHWPRESVS